MLSSSHCCSLTCSSFSNHQACSQAAAGLERLQTDTFCWPACPSAKAATWARK